MKVIVLLVLIQAIKNAYVEKMVVYNLAQSQFGIVKLNATNL